MTITANHISFSYPDGNHVLQDASLACPKGSITLLLGANGAGKSTLMKILGGIIKPLQGEVFLDNAPVLSLSPNERAKHIGMLLQNPPPPFDVTVREFVMFGRTPRLPRFHKPACEDWKAVDDAIDALELTALSKKSIRRLSGGEYQRARFAALLALESTVLLLDEPTTAQDPKAATLIGTLLQSLKNQGKTILAITHDLTWAEQTADTVVLLKHGAVFATGTPETTLTRDNIMRIY